MHRSAVRLVPIVLGLVLASSGLYTRTGNAQGATQGALASPEKFFGFRMGEDRKLANWDKLHRVLPAAGQELQ